MMWAERVSFPSRSLNSTGTCVASIESPSPATKVTKGWAFINDITRSLSVSVKYGILYKAVNSKSEFTNYVFNISLLL